MKTCLKAGIWLDLGTELTLQGEGGQGMAAWLDEQKLKGDMNNNCIAQRWC